MSKKISLFLLSFILAYTSAAQETERISIHTDKDIYIPGETIWFKAYITWNNVASIQSSNLYAGLFDEAGKLIQQKRFPIFDGTANGDFNISDSNASSLLQLRFYTKNMLASSANNIGHKIIAIVQDNQNPAPSYPVSSVNQATLQYFIEGGTMVSDILNYIVLKAESNGRPTSVLGVIKEMPENKLVDSIFTNTDGLGELRFIPSHGKEYTITWSDKSGIVKQLFLPQSIASGVVLHTELNKNKLYYKIRKSENLGRFNKLFLSLKLGKNIVYEEALATNDNKEFVNSFTTDDLPAGIFKLQLEDENKNLLQEKNIYIIKHKPAPRITVIEKNMSPKGRNVVEVLISDTLLNNLSLSITDINFCDTLNTKSIYDELLLDNDQDTPSQTKLGSAIKAGNSKKIDAILISEKLNNSAGFRVTVPDNYISLAVDYKDKNYALPEKALLWLVINDKVSGKQFLNLTPASPISFTQTGLIFYDSTKTYFQVLKNKDLSGKLFISTPAEIVFPVKVAPINEGKRIDIPTPSDEKVKPYTNNKASGFNEVKTIREVIVKTKYINPITKRLLELDKKYATGMFSGLARGYQLNVLDDPDVENYIDIYSYVRFRFASPLTVQGAYGNRKLMSQVRSGDGCEVLLFVDEREVPSEYLESVSLSQIAYIKYIPGISIGSSYTTSCGSLFIYYKKGDEPDNSANPSMKVSWIKGYDLSKEFVNPDYSDKTTLHNPDFRSTLYWNPYIISDKTNNKIRVEYYNNDIATSHLLVLKGITEDGEIIEIKKIIE